MEKKGKFDYILLETTGLADPGAVASMFWVDAELGSDIYLDGIVTVVDAKYGLQHITEEKADGLVNEAARQVALADLIIINKTDLVAEEELAQVCDAVRSINGVANLLVTQRSRVDLSEVLDLHAFDSKDGTNLSEKFQIFKPTRPHLDKSIVTVTFEVVGSLSEDALNVFIQDLLWEKTLKNKEGQPMTVIRLKGIVSLAAKAHQVMLQGVHELYELKETPQLWEEHPRISRLVFIGKNLDKDILEQQFISTVVQIDE
nr:zinc-regulated GTPase metalloprotein activator 1 isoform X2 [Doryrhamphus excisus]